MKLYEGAESPPGQIGLKSCQNHFAKINRKTNCLDFRFGSLRLVCFAVVGFHKNLSFAKNLKRYWVKSCERRVMTERKI